MPATTNTPLKTANTANAAAVLSTAVARAARRVAADTRLRHSDPHRRAPRAPSSVFLTAPPAWPFRPLAQCPTARAAIKFDLNRRCGVHGT